MAPRAAIATFVLVVVLGLFLEDEYDNDDDIPP